MKVEGQITGEAASFRAPSRFSPTGTNTSEVNPVGSLKYLNSEPGAPISYHYLRYGGEMGILNKTVQRNSSGWPVFKK